MSSIVIVGTQWGDEGKGKIVDLLTGKTDLVVRYQGGNNAGHTVVFGGNTYVLHLVPSGIFHPGKTAVLGNGVVIDPAALLEEIGYLKDHGVSVEGRLKVSDQAHLIMPYHKAFDKLRESLKGAGKIGTTGRGIGPAYEDKAGRSGVRFCDFLPENRKGLGERLKSILEEKNVLLKSHFHSDQLFDVDTVLAGAAAQYEKLKPFICDTSLLVNEALEQGRNVMFEGAQGTLLDVDHGTYPYVTSSSTAAGGACTGSGVGPTRIQKVVGITKAYTTRVGEGPFPTEETGTPVAETLQKRGHEVGATTGRIRRCGWFDGVAVRQAARLNGMTHLAITKLDVMDTLDSVNVCVAYQDEQGNRLHSLPHWLGGSGRKITPVYEEMPGWACSTRGITRLEDMPKLARRYVDRLSELAGVPIALISTGPSREETIFLEDLF
ncbi:MAG: adenylosuccinate synthase [Deltaproteobacteria bacterium]|nr:adenylosuccinate synthase [Deltaproteobacteria bacterium]